MTIPGFILMLNVVSYLHDILCCHTAAVRPVKIGADKPEPAFFTDCEFKDPDGRMTLHLTLMCLNPVCKIAGDIFFRIQNLINVNCKKTLVLGKWKPHIRIIVRLFAQIRPD